MKCLPLLCILALVGCGTNAPSPEQTGLELVASKQGDHWVVDLNNRSSQAVSASSGYAVAGQGGGNVIPVVITRRGNVVPPCVPLDSRVIFWKTGSIEAGGTRRVFDAQPEQIIQLHCLRSGGFLVAFAYQRPDGSVVFSNALSLKLPGEAESVYEPGKSEAEGSVQAR